MNSKGINMLGLLLLIYLLEESDADFNISSDSCIPAEPFVSQNKTKMLCHQYFPRRRGYCTNTIGDWLVKVDQKRQDVLENELETVKNTLKSFQKTFNIKIEKECQAVFNDVYCRWRFPKCDVTTATIRSQPICKESCEFLLKLCGYLLEFAKAVNTPDEYFLNCSDLNPQNAGDSPECYHTRFTNTETDKLEATDCYYGNGLGYLGNVSLTRSGHVCQSWSSQCPHRHDHPVSEYPELINVSNWCRNPGGQGSKGPWCYTTNSSVRWEYCNVEKCPPPAPSRSPVVIQAIATGSSTIYLAWAPVPLPFIHGQLRGFRVLIENLGEEGKRTTNTTSGNVRHIEIDNLRPLTNYSLSVLVFNENGDGPLSLPVYVKTMPQNFVSVKYMVSLNHEVFSRHLLNKDTLEYRKLASKVKRMVSRLLQETKSNKYKIFQIRISKFIGSVYVEFYITAELTELVLPTWSVSQDITGRMLQGSQIKSKMPADHEIELNSLVVKASPPPPANLSQSDVSMTSVTVIWSPPLYHGPYRITNYTVQYKKANTDMSYYDAVFVNSNKTRANVPNLDSDKKYLMRVVSVNAYGSTASQPVTVKTRAESVGSTAIGIVLAVVTTTVVIIIVCGVVWWRWRNNIRRKQLDKQLKFINLFEALGIEVTKNWWEIPREDLKIDERLGSGAFGVVMKAYLTMKEDGKERNIMCAVKMLKENPTERELRDLCNEINVMASVGDHPNIISLIGACTLNGPPWLVVKFAVNGCLFDYLVENRTNPYYNNLEDFRTNPITPKEKLKFARDIAQGMSHLEKNRVVHRDLCCHNILLGTNMVAMVSDFGLSRDVYEMGVYENTSGGILPVRWMSLESLENYTYTSESDVWSYGVVLWEIENEGLMPYAGMTSGPQIFEYLKQGYRLENHENTSSDLDAIMKKCWNREPKERPTFASLVNDINELLKEYEVESVGGLNHNNYEEIDHDEIVRHHDNLTIDKEHYHDNGGIDPDYNASQYYV